MRDNGCLALNGTFIAHQLQQSYGRRRGSIGRARVVDNYKETPGQVHT